VLGAFDKETGGGQRWQVSLGWRYQKSDRHFRQGEEEENRQEEGSEVINTIHLADLGIRYNFDPQTSISVGIPFLMAERSSPIRDDDRVVVDRSISQARGLGDVTVVGRRLLFDPLTQPKGNLSLGLGVKLPTGANNVNDRRTRLIDGERVTTIETVDQSIQPGDGGFGVIVDFSGFRQLGTSGEYALYASGVYLINPEGTNGVATFRSREGEEIMSIADQYLLRLGAIAGPQSWKGWSVGLGGRIEGVPVHDLVGSSNGFRRPGYAISVEPTVSWTKGPHSVSLSLPIAVERNRQRSVSDIRNGTAGDAAFADWVLLVGYWRSF